MDSEFARSIAQSFVCVKVDRDDDPALAAACEEIQRVLTATSSCPSVIALSGGGEPVATDVQFLAPPKGPLPWREFVGAVRRCWEESRADAVGRGRRLLRHLDEPPMASAKSQADENTLQAALSAILRVHDSGEGGFGRSRKLLRVPALDLLLHAHVRSHSAEYLNAALRSLRAMARGAVRDHIGGGFHHGAEDPGWRHPRFEKLLAENAAICRTFLSAYQITGDLEFAAVARETLDYILRELRLPDGTFSAGQSAVRPDVSGDPYGWTPAEVKAVLGRDLGDLACRCWGIEETASRQGAVPHLAVDVEDLASTTGRSYVELRLALGEARARLFAFRSRQRQVARDTRAPTAANAWAIRALLRASELFGEPGDLEAARTALKRLTGCAVDVEKKTVFRFANAPATSAVLDDYAALVASLLDLWELEGSSSALQLAAELNDAALKLFRDQTTGLLRLAPPGRRSFLPAVRADRDGETASAAAVMVENLLRLGAALDRPQATADAEAILAAHAPWMLAEPVERAGLLHSLAWHLDGTLVIAVRGVRRNPDTEAVLEQIRRRYLPTRCILVTPPEAAGTESEQKVGPERARGASAQPHVVLQRRGRVLGRATGWLELLPLLERHQ